MGRTSVLASAARILAHAVLVSVIKPTPTAGMILPRRFFSHFAAFFMSFLLLRVMYPDYAWQDSHITLKSAVSRLPQLFNLEAICRAADRCRCQQAPDQAGQHKRGNCNPG